MTRHQFVAGLSTLLLAAALPACGIRGRPQPPLIILPAVVQDLSAVRLGDEVHLELTVPEANADGSQPPDIERIDIYAVTTLPAADDGPLVLDEWIEDEDPVFTFDVVVPEEPGAEGDADAAGAAGDRTDEAPAEAAAHAPGEVVTAMELLTPDIVEPVEIDPEEEDQEDEELDEAALEEAADGTPLAGPLVSPPLPRVPRRTYVAVAVSRRNRQSAAFAAPPVPVQPAPDPPGVPVVTYTETSIDIEWTAPDTARLPVQRAVAADGAGGDSLVEEVAAEVDEAAEDAAEPAPAADEPEAAEQTEPAAAADPAAAAEEPETEAAAEEQEGEAGEAAADAGETPVPPVLESTMLLSLQAPTGYDVYDVSPPAETETETETGTEQGGGPAAGDGGILQPLNGEPLATTSQTGLPAALGVERCFHVRTVDTVDPVDSLPIRSAASETTCVLLADIFPPAAPAGLVAVAGAGAISLTWDANGEADLAGYVVLRGRDPEAELEALTPEPIAATNYRDAEVEAGGSYVYAVRALDGAEPPNVSEPSAQVEEQAP